MKTNLTWLFILILLSIALDNVQSKKKSKSNVIVINNSGGGGGSTNTIVKSNGKGKKDKGGYDVVLTSGGSKCGGCCKPHVIKKHVLVPVHVHKGHHHKGWW